jgi:tagatose 6-phosphate kinase
MIVTITLNLALRVRYEAQRVDCGAPNQVRRVRYRAGGRGLAIARVLRTLGNDVIAAGLAGGTTGDLIRRDLARSDVQTRFTAISGDSRPWKWPAFRHDYVRSGTLCDPDPS